jgi:hypothetical protein
MTNILQYSAERPRLGFVQHKQFPVLVLAGLGLLILLMRLHTYIEPLETDLTSYAVIGHEMLGGRALYTDLWDHKPPGIHLTYALATLIFGYGRFAVFAMGMLSAWAIMLGVYRLVKWMTKEQTPALWAAAFWAVLCSSLELQANQPNVEVFMNVCLVWAMVFLARIEPGRLSLGPAILSGLLFFAASLYKQIALCAPVLAGLGYVVACWRQRPQALAAGAGNVAALAMPVIIGWLAVFGYFVVRGHWQDFYDANVAFNRTYSGSLLGNITYGLKWSLLFPARMASFKMLLPLAATALLVPCIRPVPRAYGVFLGYFVATPLMIMLPGRFYAHYYQLWTPALVLAAGIGCHLLARIPSVTNRLLSWAVPFAVCGGSLAMELPAYGLGASDWSAHKYGRLFLDSDEIGTELKWTLRPEESFFQWGWWSGLYFTTQHRPPSGILYAYPLRNGPLQKELAARLLADLQREQPEIIVAAKNEYYSMDMHPDLRGWMNANYRPSPRIHPGPAFWFIRRGGRLEREWIGTTAEWEYQLLQSAL